MATRWSPSKPLASLLVMCGFHVALLSDAGVHGWSNTNSIGSPPSRCAASSRILNVPSLLSAPPPSAGFSKNRPSRISRTSRRESGVFPLYASASVASGDDADSDDGDDSKTTSYGWTKQNLQLAIPALVGMLADPLLSLMDTAYVGRVGATELAALGACTSIFHLAFNAFRATTAATTSLVGNAESEEQRHQIVQTSLNFGFFLGIMLLISLRLAGPWCLKTMGVPQTSVLYPPASAYLQTRLWAAPAILGIVVSEGAFRGYGDTKIPLAASLVASAVNLVLDPLLMFPLKMGVKGAAAATAFSQFAAVSLYMYYLRKRNMLPKRGEAAAPQKDSYKVVRAIIGANLAMVCKQGSLLLSWAYATSRATRLGHAHVAAHQVALSCWLVFALILDGAGVSSQVLVSRSIGKAKKLKSLVSYMSKWSIAQGLVTTGVLLAAAPFLPNLFTSDPAIRGHLHALMPQVALQQVLVSATLVMESLATGGSQFKLLAIGTTISTVFSMWQLQQATSVVGIWSRGIVTLFVGRLITALIGVARVLYKNNKAEKEAH